MRKISKKKKKPEVKINDKNKIIKNKKEIINEEDINTDKKTIKIKIKKKEKIKNEDKKDKKNKIKVK